MNCPIDQSQLEPFQSGQLAFHFCHSCHGMFFARDAYMTSLRSGKMRLDFGEAAEVDAAAAATVKERPCPTCISRLMFTKSVGNIEIDFCRGCQGIWLDAGELEAIIARKQQHDEEALNAPQPGLRPHIKRGQPSTTGNKAEAVSEGASFLGSVGAAGVEELVGGIFEGLFDL